MPPVAFGRSTRALDVAAPAFPLSHPRRVTPDIAFLRAWTAFGRLCVPPHTMRVAAGVEEATCC